MADDIDLLKIETEVLWTIDDRGRLLASRGRSGARAPHLSIGTSHGARTIATGSVLPDALADELRAAVVAEPLPINPAQEPAAFGACERLLHDALGQVERSAGRAWVIQSLPKVSSDAYIVKSTDAGMPAFARSVPDGFTWEQDEWQDLMNGKLGAWAMCTVGGVPVSLCHCARIAPVGIEAGTWTHPDHRGRGYAAAATAAWAALVLPGGRQIFYSTNAGNRSSERVTERLNLRPIGWRWMLSGTTDPSAPSPG